MLFLATSALVKRYVAEEGTELVLGRMGSDPDWAVSSVARPEAEITLCRLGFDRDDSADVWRRLRDDWERCHVVPADLDCLERAGEIGCRYELRTLDAIHFAAADRLPRPLEILTFDHRQAAAARAMELLIEGV